MNSAAKILVFILFLIGVSHQRIISKNPDSLIHPLDNYWVVIANEILNKPSFSANITVRAPNGTVEYSIDCSTSSQILYYNNQLVFLTNRTWTVGVTYYITFDEGVLFSDGIDTSCARLSNNFWPIRVVQPLNG